MTPEKEERLGTRGKPYPPEKRREVAKYAFTMGAAKAERIYKIPKSTIRKWMKKETLNSPRCFRLGRPLSYPSSLETKIKEHIFEQIEKGIGVTTEDLRNFGKSVIEGSCPDFKASRSWVLGFLKRHNFRFDGRFLQVKGEVDEEDDANHGMEDEDSASGDEHG